MADQALSTDIATELRLLRGLIDVGAKLYGCRDRQQLLDTILCEARRLTGAEAGSLYLVDDDHLKFVAVQNDRMDTSEIARHLLGKEMPLSKESLAGYIALAGELTNIPDSYHLPEGAPFRVNRDVDAKTGYSVKSVLGIPLNCPDGECVGVLQLFNRLDENGNTVPFPAGITNGILLMSSSAAITVHNIQLQNQLRQVHLNTIYRLSILAEYRDADTSEHIHRVSSTAALIAKAMGMGSDQVELIKYASPMHDVGKVAVPDAVLLKPGNLSPKQRKIMQNHTIVGAEIFSKPEDDVLQMARDIALGHHERWDGQGYPNKQSGKEIPLSCRIVALADVFDAVVSRRCYKNACSLDVALDILQRDSGVHFDADAVKAFFEVLDDILAFYPEAKAS